MLKNRQGKLGIGDDIMILVNDVLAVSSQSRPRLKQVEGDCRNS